MEWAFLATGPAADWSYPNLLCQNPVLTPHVFFQTGTSAVMELVLLSTGSEAAACLQPFTQRQRQHKRTIQKL